MADILIYVREGCPYCARAMHLLSKKGAAFETIDIGHEPGRRAEMIERAKGRATVPQIFIGDRHIGGSDDLYALEKAGKLDALLKK